MIALFCKSMSSTTLSCVEPWAFQLDLPSVLVQAHQPRSGTERERKFNLSIQPALAYEDVSMLESSAKLRMAAKQ